MSKQNGFSLVPALFLIVVLAVLGAVAVRMNMIEHQTAALAMQSARAMAAARTGIDRAAYDALVNGNCGNATLALSEAGLNGFTVSTSCSTTSHNEGTAITSVFTIEAFAWSGAYGQPSYVSRRLRTTVTDAS